MAYWDRTNKTLNQKEEKKKTQQENKRIEQQQQNVASTFGVQSLEGTGYKTFKELVSAYNRKMKSIAARDYGESPEETRRYSGGISSLIGRNTTLG